ncbi:hypothetical protein [Flectobacillus roseus]|uniref:hypothetical protein n=1 Tax=Flectobacillus roseus TaxID=502259 RepID=UPI0024B78555|nr:hypothetical protein [Flectobacillus roseus]MDI9868957.1 hypothetical protein [Flectobacillus roseus]
MQRLIIIFLCAFITSCSGQDNSSISKKSSQVNTATSFKKEIPTYKNGGVDLFYELKKQKEKQLNLDSLESGFDSLQIRIWYDYALLINRELIVIKRTNGKWSAEHYQMAVDWDAFKTTEVIKINKIKSVLPKSGWDNFFNKLLSFKIMTLPNMDDISGLEDNWTDGVTYNIEIATKKQYRFYGYHLPDKFQDKFWQAKNMTEILSLISTELRQ